MKLRAPYILLDDQVTSSVRLYQRPIEVIRAKTPEDIPAAFDAIALYQRAGYQVAGFASYELGMALEPKLLDLLPGEQAVPLMEFGIFKDYETIALESDIDILPRLRFAADWSEEDYAKRFDKVIDYITAGDVYQINLTFPMRSHYDGSAQDLYMALRQRQPGHYGGVVSLGGAEILSLSPELFFKKTGNDVEMRPMKGTMRRHADPEQDAILRESMRADEKSQAENLMIVDLLRNDLSRICEAGSVDVPELFALETYPTLHQMTSSITGTLKPETDLQDILRAMFPCGSVTGAPKIRAMEIIRELEDSARGAYCGAIGYWDPSGAACFNVAIRTLTLQDQELTYNVGGGVVLDSAMPDEYAECLLKAKVVSALEPNLIETFLWTPDERAVRRGKHLARLFRSAKTLGYEYSEEGVKTRLDALDYDEDQRVRLSLSANGDIDLEVKPFEVHEKDWTVSISKNPLTPDVQETRFKMADRDFYDGERQRVSKMTGCDEVIFLNGEGKIAEGSFTSLFAEKNGQLYTPPLSAGILPGILRAELIQNGRAQETAMEIVDLVTADQLYIGNSLRGLIEVTLLDTQPH